MPSQPEEGALKNRLKQLAVFLKRIAGKAVETLPVIAGRVVDVILNSFVKPIGLLHGHAWALIVFISGLIGITIGAKSKKADTSLTSRFS